MNRILSSTLFILAIVALVIGGCAQPSPATKPAAPSPTPAPAAVTAAEFYKNNTVTLICPMTPGAGSDYAARLLASYWPDATDGGAMIVKNMEGGGGLVGANFISTAKTDGLTLGLGMLATSYIGPMVFKDPALKLDPTKQTWIGGFFGEPTVGCVIVGSPYKSAKDIRNAKGLKFGSAGVNASGTIFAALLGEFLGLENFSIIAGYGGGSAVVLALGKKEIDGQTAPYSTVLSGITKGFSAPPFVIFEPKRDASLPDTPSIYEVADMTSEKEALLKAGMAVGSSLRTIGGPPGIAADKVKFLSDAFVKITAMKGFKDQANFYFPLWTDPVSGDKILEDIKQSQTLPIDKLKSTMNKYLATTK
jgi:tripartite-type tricarboxylate transporter receptor subunit TctC